MKARFTFLSGARSGQVEAFRKAYIGLGRHPLSDVRFDAERDLDVSSRHAAVLRKPEGFVLQDLGSKNGTFVNGRRLDGEVVLKDGDVIGFGAHGPALEFRVLEADIPEAVPAGVEGSAPRRSSTAMRIALEVARQTQNLRRTTKILIGLLVATALGFGLIQWQGSRDRSREITDLRRRADSLAHSVQELAARSQADLKGVRDALAQSQTEAARLRHELAAAGGDDAAMTRLRGQLEDAERRQRALIGAVGGVDYRAVSQKNQDAVAMVLVEFSEEERFSGTAFAVDSNGTLVTNKHVLVGEEGNRAPRKIGVIFSGSTQMFRGDLVGVSNEADIGVLRVSIKGGTPRVSGLARDRRSVQRGDPVAIIGYPLGFDLPMEAQGQRPIADPTLTVGTVSKALTSVVQVDGYGAPGSSGSPIFDREGRVIGMLYGGERESQGRIIYAVPAYFIVDYLKSLGLMR